MAMNSLLSSAIQCNCVLIATTMVLWPYTATAIDIAAMLLVKRSCQSIVIAIFPSTEASYYVTIAVENNFQDVSQPNRGKILPPYQLLWGIDNAAPQPSCRRQKVQKVYKYCIQYDYFTSVRMAERSKAPDSRVNSYAAHRSVLVHVCGRGFESHF
jgi:hypothetical protein